MGNTKVTICLLMFACMTCLIEASGFQTQNHETSSSFRSSSGTFGLKTISKQTVSSTGGTATNTWKQSDAPAASTASPPAQSTQATPINQEQELFENNNFRSIDHSFGQDDTVYGLLPADNLPQTPSNFGTRIQSRNNDDPNCQSNGGCSKSLQSSVSEFGVSSSESEQGQLTQEGGQQKDDESVQSFAEQRENVDNIQQQNQDDDQYSDDRAQGRSMFFENGFFDSTGQFDNTFRNVGLEDINDNSQAPNVDGNFPDQGNNQQVFPGDEDSPLQNQEIPRPENVPAEERQSPSFFDYVDQQSYIDEPAVDQVSGAFDAVPVEAGDIPFQRNTGGNYRDNSFNQDSSLQPFSPQQSSVPNENRDDFRDEEQDNFFNEDPIQALRYNVPGSPGEDYPIFYEVPETSFDCNQQQFAAGIYGDMDAQCQVFHFCKESGGRDSFLCPNGTVFNQQYFVCDWWYNYNCADTPGFYNLNAQLYWDIDSISPSQILSGSGLGTQEDGTSDQVDNSGGFAIQGVSSDTPIQTPSANTQPIRNFEQQSFDAVSSFEEDTKHSSSGFGGQHGGASFQQGSSRTNTENQRSFAHSTSFSFQGSSVGGTNLRNNPAQNQVVFPNEPININSNVEDFSQTHIDSEDDFRQTFDERAPVPTNFEQQHISRSDENLNSGSVTNQNINRANQVSEKDASKVAQVSIINDQFESSDHSTSSDPSRNSQSGSDAGTQFPDQSGFEQQQRLDEQHQVQSDLKNKEHLDQVKLDEQSPGFKNVDFFQDTQKDIADVIPNTFQEENKNIPLAEDVFQQGVDLPSEEASLKLGENSESVKDSSSGFPNDGFDNENRGNVEQQKFDSVFENENRGSVEQQKFDSVFENENRGSVEQHKLDPVFENNENNVFNMEDTFSSNEGSLTNDDKTSFDTQVIENSQNSQANVQEQQAVEDLIISNINDEGETSVNEEKQTDANSKSSFDQQILIDVPNINQEAVDFDEILDGFQDRNVAFKDANSEFQTNDRTTNENRVSLNGENGNTNQGNTFLSQKPAEEIGFTKDQNNNRINQNLGQNSQTEFSQQKIQENNIYNMMRGFPNNAPVNRNRPYPDQQRFNFRPYGQNGSPTFNSNIEVSNQNSERLQRNQNGQVSQQNFNEQVIFPNGQYQRNAENQPWQQRGNFYSGNLPNQNLRSTGRPQQQSSQNYNRPSNQNWNVPTNGHQIRTPEFRYAAQNDLNRNRNAIQQTNQQNFNDGNPAYGTNSQPQIQNVPQPNIRSLSNDGPGRNQRVKGVVSPVQSQFRPVQDNFNVQQVPSQNRNQQAQTIPQNRNQQAQTFPQNRNQQTQTIPQNRNVEQVNPSSVTIGQQQENPGIKGRFSQNQPQFQNSRFNSGRNQNQNTPQTVQTNAPEPDRQSQFQRNTQVNIQQQIVPQNAEGNPNQNQFQSVNIPNNNQQQFVQENIQDQFQNTVSLNSRNLPNENNRQFVHQNIKGHGQRPFQNNVPFHSVSVRNENNPQFIQQNVQNQEQGQSNNAIPFNSGNIPTENNQQFFQNQFQNSDQLNSGNNGNNQQFVPQNAQFQQEEFIQEQHAQFQQNEQSHIQNEPQDNFRDHRGFQESAGTKGHFPQEQRLFQNAPIPSNNGGQDIAENSRSGRSSFNSPNAGRIRPQKIDANDAVTYSQNEPPAAESAISYNNGWRPIIRN